MALAKGFSDEKTNNDRISEIPTNIMDNIFDRISIRDAARTSILSRKWRYVWASYPKLVFDENFFDEINLKPKRFIGYEFPKAINKVLNFFDEFIRYEFPKAINKVLSVHSGPVLVFSLHIPDLPIDDLSPEIDQWMLFLSRNGIKKLKLENPYRAPYILPCCILSCSSLIDLNAYYCILQPPETFGGFRYLVKLRLEEALFSTNMSAALLLNFPVLESLTILNCTGIEHRSIRAPMLNYLSMVGFYNVDWKWFENNKKLTVVQIELCMEVKNIEKTVNMIKFLGDILKVQKLWLDGFSLKYLSTANPHKIFKQQHPYVIHSSPLALLMTEIRLREFGVDDHDQISSAICLLKNCPHLFILELDFAASTNNVTELVTEYLEPSNCMDVSLDMLETLKIRNMKGLKAELLFIKLLLLRSKSLQKMIIEPSSAITPSTGFTISKELLRFPRASSSAEIIYVDPAPAE